MRASSINIHGHRSRHLRRAIHLLRDLGRIHEQTVRTLLQPLSRIQTTNNSTQSLGLRSAVAKTLLLLCDLYFIVFAASNLSLAFDALFDHRWACYDETFERVGNTGNVGVPATCPDNPQICNRQRALSGVLVVSLVAWLATFSISVMRVVEKLR